MNKNTKFLKIALLAITMLMLVAATPIEVATAADAASVSSAAEDIVVVSIKNKGPKTLTITFLGLNVYNFEAPPGTTKINMVRGTYQTSYFGCGGHQIGHVTLKAKNNEVTFEDCNKWVPEEKDSDSDDKNSVETAGILFAVHNKNHLKIEVTLIGGPDNYVIDAAPGVRTRTRVLPGPYQYSYYACGKLHIGNFEVTKKNDELKVISCFENQNTAENAPPTHRELIIKNRQYLSMEVSLTGVVESYELKVPNGNHSHFVHKGPYTYAYFACGEVYIGVINVGDKGATLTITECGEGGNGNALAGSQLSFHLKNNTGETLVIKLTGPQTYLYVVAGSGDALVVTKGFYNYRIWACGKSYSGVINVYKEDVLLKSPYCKGPGGGL